METPAENHRLTNYHSHTPYCDGRCDMEEFVATAVWLGFASYGISPHSPLPLPSGCNMKRERVADFIEEMERLKRKYGRRIELYTGMEIDFIGDEWGPSNDFFASLPLDYRIGAVHFLRCDDGGFAEIDCSAATFKEIADNRFGGNIRRLVERYFAAMLDMIECGGFDFAAHPDKISMNASAYSPGITEEKWYSELLHAYFERIAATGTMLEVNTKAYSRTGFLFPNRKWFAELKRLGIELTVNSDAHIPALMTCGFDDTKRFLREAGYDHVMQLKGGVWRENPL